MTTGAAVSRLAVEWLTCLPFAHPSIGVASAARSAVTKTNEFGPPIMGHVPVATFKPRAGECHVHMLRILTDVSCPALLKLEDVSRLNTLGGLGHFLSVSKTLLASRGH